MKKQMAVLMAAMAGTVVFSMSALAAEEIDPFDLSLTVGGKTYEIPMSVDDARDAGLNVPELGELKKDYSYFVDVDDGRNSFSLTVSLVDDLAYAVGYRVKTENVSDVIAGGISLNDTTKEELVAQLEELHGFRWDVSDNEITVRSMRIGYNWTYYLDGDKINEVAFTDDIPLTYGLEFSDAVGQTEDDLPDPGEMAFSDFILDGKYYQWGDPVQKLLDNGWKLSDSDSQTELKAGTYTYANLCNGSSIIQVDSANTGSEDGLFADGIIYSIEVKGEWNSNLILADGLTMDSSIDDFTAVFGEPSSQHEADENGYASVTYRVQNNRIVDIETHNDVIYDLEIR